jgi:hypothetical protein
MTFVKKFKADNSFGNENKIFPNDTFLSLFGNPTSPDHFNEISKTERYQQLNEKYKAIFETGRNEGLQPGEVQVLIHVFSDGKPLHEIEYRRLDDLKLFIRHNSSTFLSFVQPELHAFLLKTGYFKKDNHTTIKQSRLKRICSVMEKLAQKTDSRKKLTKFAEILSKL